MRSMSLVLLEKAKLLTLIMCFIPDMWMAPSDLYPLCRSTDSLSDLIKMKWYVNVVVVVVVVVCRMGVVMNG